MTGTSALNAAARVSADSQQTSRRRALPRRSLAAISVGVLACWAARVWSAGSQASTEDAIHQTRLVLPARVPRWQAQLAALPELPRGVKADLSVWGNAHKQGVARAWDAYTMAGLSLCPCPNAPLAQRREFVAQVCNVAQQKQPDEKHALVLTDLGSGDLLQLTLQIEALLVTQPRLTVQIIEATLPAIACGNFTVDAGTLSARAPQDRSCLDRETRFALARSSDVDRILPFLAALQVLTQQHRARIDIDVYQSAQTYVDAVLAGSIPKSDIITMVDPGKLAPVPWPLANRVEGTDAQGSFTVHAPAQGGQATLEEVPSRRGWLPRLLSQKPPEERAADVLAPLPANLSHAETLRVLHEAFPEAKYVDHIFEQMSSLHAVAPNATWAYLAGQRTCIGDGPLKFG